MCLTQDGLGIFLLTQPLPEDSEKRSCRAIRIEDGASSYCTGTQSQDFTSMFQEGLRVVNIHGGNENHPRIVWGQAAQLVPLAGCVPAGGLVQGNPVGNRLRGWFSLVGRGDL